MERVRDGWLREVMGTGKRYKIGRFEGIRMLGEGGFGLVLLVRDPELDREVALKLLRVPQPSCEEAILREAQLLARISHPNVITVHETGHHGDDVFYVMERVVGYNGHKFISYSESWKEVIEVYIEAGIGLAVAHEHGIVHGDFKPGNILIPDDGGPVRVADFGLARFMFEDGDGVRHRLGTLPYTAPEVLRGHPGDARSDQWSFCVSLWQSLERTLPFEGETVSELLEDIDLHEPLAREPWVPQAVRAAVLRGLALDPADRYADMRTLVEELATLLCTPSGTLAGGGRGGGRSTGPDERLLNLPSASAERPASRMWLGYGFGTALLGGLIAAALVSPLKQAPTSTAEAPAVVEVPAASPFVQVMALVDADDFEQAQKVWRESQSSEPLGINHEQSVIIALACVERAKRRSVEARAVAFAVAISGVLWNIEGSPSAKKASARIDDALAEFYRNRAGG